MIALDKETTHQDIGCLAGDGVLLFDGDEIDFTSESKIGFHSRLMPHK